MTESKQSSSDVYQFIVDQIDSVPHLEAMLLLWNSRPKAWSADEVARRLYVARDFALSLLEDLRRQELITAAADQPEHYNYQAGPDEKDQLMGAVDEAYRREVIRVSTLIHAKASSSIREFARAFRFTKKKV